MIPVIAAAARVVAVGSARVVAVTARGLASAGLKLGALAARLATRVGVSAKTMFTPKGKKVMSVKAKGALKKLDRFEQIVQEVTKDALPVMIANTARAPGPKGGNAKRSTKYKNGTLIADYNYATYIDKPNYQKNNVSAEGRKHGITKPTEAWIKKEIQRRVKKELGR